MKIVIDEDKWRLPCNRAQPREHSEEKQREIWKQDALLELGVIKELQVTEWSQVHQRVSQRSMANKVLAGYVTRIDRAS